MIYQVEFLVQPIPSSCFEPISVHKQVVLYVKGIFQETMYLNLKIFL